MKEEFKTFATNVFTRLGKSKSSIRVPVPEPSPSPLLEALKANIETLQALSNEVKNLYQLNKSIV